MILVPVVGARPIKHVHSRLILRTSHSRRHGRHVFQVTAILDAVAAVQRGVGSGVDHGLNAVCCCNELFATLLSLGKHSRRHIEGRVFSCSSFSEHLWSLFFFSVKG